MNNKENSVQYQFLLSVEQELEAAESKAVSLTKLRNIFLKVEDTCKNNAGTALEFISGLGFIRIARALINHGYDVNSTNSKGLTPLHMATLFDRTAICELLLTNGAKVDSIEMTGKTPLHIAAYKNNADLVRLFLKFGADQMLRTPENCTAAQIAISKDHKGVVLAFRDQVMQKMYKQIVSEAQKIITDKNSTKQQVERLKRAGFTQDEALEPCDSPLKF